MRRPFAFLLPGLLAFAALAAGSLVSTAPASAATTIAATTTCSNGVDNTGGLGLICEVTIVNTFTATGGSATVSVRECHGAAGNPQAACTITPMVLTEAVTAVTQCNSSINGGGGTLRCSVNVTNNFVGVPSTVTAATVNQCVGSGGGITTGCNPFPATTTGATITQCNGSANGGTLVGLTCTASGTQSSGAGVLVNQCNGSANGGGALVICTANITNNAVAATPTPTPGGTPTPTPTETPSPTGTPAPGATPTPGATPAPNATPIASPVPTLPNTSTVDQASSQGIGISPSILAGLSLLVVLWLIVAFKLHRDRQDVR